MYKKEAASPGLIQHGEKVKSTNVFSCLKGGHGGESNRLFLELHSRRTRCNGTELHL